METQTTVKCPELGCNTLMIWKVSAAIFSRDPRWNPRIGQTKLHHRTPGPRWTTTGQTLASQWNGDQIACQRRHYNELGASLYHPRVTSLFHCESVFRHSLLLIKVHPGTRAVFQAASIGAPGRSVVCCHRRQAGSAVYIILVSSRTPNVSGHDDELQHLQAVHVHRAIPLGIETQSALLQILGGEAIATATSVTDGGITPRSRTRPRAGGRAGRWRGGQGKTLVARAYRGGNPTEKDPFRSRETCPKM